MSNLTLSHPLVRQAVNAMNSGDRSAWFAVFTKDATLTDDGNKEDFVAWSDREIFGEGKGRLTAVDSEQDGGLMLSGTFQSAEWGSFRTFFRFHERGGKLTGLDVGQLKI
jgi:hypothetical protein